MKRLVSWQSKGWVLKAVCCPLPLLQVLFEAQGRNNRQKAVDLEDIKFHQCVRLARFDNDR